MRKLTSCILSLALLSGGLAGFTACKREARTPSYDIRAEFLPEESKLVCEMTVTVTNRTENALESLSFELWANAYREGALCSPVSELYSAAAYFAGESFGGMEITQVTGGSFEIAGEDENILRVALEEPLYPDEWTALDISFTTTLARVNHRLGVGVRNVNLAHFYPQLCAFGEDGFLEYVYSSNGDPFVSDCADYTLTLIYPAHYRAAFSGTGQIAEGGDRNTLTLRAENVRDIAVVLGNFESLTDSVGGVELCYYYTTDESPERTLRAAKDSLEYFSRTFGEYGYPRYAVVETDFPYGGMEYPGLAMISSALKEEDVPEVVAHETAHQWWYAMVGSNQFEHAWQDEGLAEYSAALFLGAYPEYGSSYEQAISRSESGYRAYFSVKSQLSGEKDTGMDKPLTAYSGEYEYRNVAYDKGVILFDRVRQVVGERKFFSALKAYASDYAGKIASPQELIACFHRAGGNVEALFCSFTEGKCVI